MFESIYKNLNSAQRKAVETIDGPVMVVAGPGTGKTTMLTLRIANILKRTDTAPENILALTFTESGAYAMRKKLVEIVGPTGYRVVISTFHGFCNDIIRRYPEKFPGIIGATPIADIDQIALMEEIIDTASSLTAPISLLRPYGDPAYYVKPVLGVILDLKREGITPEAFAEIIKKEDLDFETIPDLYHEKGAHKGKMKGEHIKLKESIAKNKELVTLYSAYQKALRERRYYDYEDMIMEVVALMRRDADFLLILQETHQYILADEHQDANNAQNAVLELLSNFHSHPNIFIVGDEKQAIFRFQGASLDNFLYFKNLYPDAVLIHLEDNYRSQQHILDVAHHLIGHNEKAVERTRLKSNSPHALRPTDIYECPNTDTEYEVVVKNIEKQISFGVKLDEIAVLYRNNSDAFPLASALSRRGIAHRIESDQDLMSDQGISKLILILRAINNPTDGHALGSMLFVDTLSLPVVSVYEVIGQANKERKPLHTIVPTAFPDVWAKIATWASLARNKSCIETIETVIRESGYLDDVIKSKQSLEEMAVLETFFNEIRKLSNTVSENRRQYSLSDFIEFLDRADTHGIFIKASTIIENKASVRLMTAHRSKGLEFEHVYVIGCYDGHWGNGRDRKLFKINALHGSIKTGDPIEDERRLFYVALTRAKKSISLSFALKGIDGRDQLPSQFIAELDQNLVLKHDSVEVAKEYTLSLAHRFVPTETMELPVTDADYVRERFLDQGLSVTALNNYLECAWKYFFTNLIRLPQVQTKHQMYGTAVHEALQVFFNKYREEADLSREELLEIFAHYLRKQPIFAGDLDATLEKGRVAIGGYYDTYKGIWSRSLLTEYAVKKVMLEGVPLTGKLDKIELMSDSKVNVVDYKTGSPKSRNDIEGKTKTSNGNYKRQLVFYRILLDLDESKRFHMVSGELDFVEPADNGTYRKERFEITDEEVSDLKKTIATVGEEITSLAFMARTCEKRDCEYCRLSKLIAR